MKNTRLRHAEYYGITEIFDELYVKSKDKQKFKNLMSIITSDNNILLAIEILNGITEALRLESMKLR